MEACNGFPMSAFTQVGSVFEIINKNPLFGIVQPSSPVWLPILGFFAVTGVPSAGDIICQLEVPPQLQALSRTNLTANATLSVAGFLLFKAINAANEQAERQNKMDGY